MIDRMKIYLNDGSCFPIVLHQHCLQTTITKWYKHLGNIDIPWNKWNYSPWFYQDPSVAAQELKSVAFDLGIDVDSSRFHDQAYMNYLHAIFEQRYDNRPQWLEYNALIHALEKHTGSQSTKPVHKILEINYGHLAGPLKIKFRYEWLGIATLKVPKGTVYLAWDEKGKNPWSYYYDREETDMERFCEMCRPWIWLTTKLQIALEDLDFAINPDPAWREWYSKRQPMLCKHYDFPEWNINDMQAVIPVGTVNNVNYLEDSIKQKKYPIRCKLDL
jgi:hypothetical protein